MRDSQLPLTAEDVVEIVTLFETKLKDGTYIRLSTYTSPLVSDGYIWEATGTLGKISNLKDATGMSAARVTVSLFGIPITQFPTISAEKYRHLPCRILIQRLVNGQVHGAPAVAFKGQVVESKINPGPQMTLALTLSSALVTMKKNASSRYTHAEQRSKYPDDLGLEFVANMKNIRLEWNNT